MKGISLREIARTVFLLVFYAVGASLLFYFNKAKEVLKSVGLFVGALISVVIFFLAGAIGHFRSLKV